MTEYHEYWKPKEKKKCNFKKIKETTKALLFLVAVLLASKTFH